MFYGTERLTSELTSYSCLVTTQTQQMCNARHTINTTLFTK